MRRCASLFVAAAACSSAPAAHRDASGARDVAPDAPGACGGKLWIADFSTDPTTYDHNGDGTNDFAMRDMQPLGGSLADGVWTQAAIAIRPLDTQPKQDFTTRTLIHVRMRDETAPTQVHGAVCWLNFGYDGTSFAPVFIDAALQSNGTQTATLFGKDTNGSEVPLAQVLGLDTGMHDYYLDVDPSTYNVTFAVDAMPPLPRAVAFLPVDGNDDRWATVDAWTDVTAQFDYFSVEVCP